MNRVIEQAKYLLALLSLRPSTLPNHVKALQVPGSVTREEHKAKALSYRHLAARLAPRHLLIHINRHLLNQISMVCVPAAFWKPAGSSCVDFTHVTEYKRRAQNSTPWIKIRPLNVRAYPRTVFH